jgi:predicted glycoside hydrolase/deacetylase ChbG (UPF0249 family)
VNSFLIINADDYGRTPGVSGGIREAHRRGIVSSTTVLINQPNAMDDLLRARDETPDLSTGLHLNLTLGNPILPGERIASLVTPSGQFLPRDRLFQNMHAIDPGHVYDEWHAQIELMTDQFQKPDHLDSHHHVALLNSEIWGKCLRLAKEFACPIRPPFPDDLGEAALGSFLPPESLEFAKEVAPAMLREYGVRSPDAFLAGFFAEGAAQSKLDQVLGHARPGVTELMCHPGYADLTLIGASGYAFEREHELQLLTSPGLEETLRAAGWTLTTYHALWPS